MSSRPGTVRSRDRDRRGQQVLRRAAGAQEHQPEHRRRRVRRSSRARPGCGKSTLLKLIAGLEEITDGEIYVGGKLANYLRPSARDVAMVFQNYALYPHMTVEQNIAFPLKMARTSERGDSPEGRYRCEAAAPRYAAAPVSGRALRRPEAARRSWSGHRPRARRVPDG